MNPAAVFSDLKRSEQTGRIVIALKAERDRLAAVSRFVRRTKAMIARQPAWGTGEGA